MASPLSYDKLLEAAARRTGGENFGDAAFQPALQALLDSLNREAMLHPSGVWQTATGLIGSLIKRATVANLQAEQPNIFATPLVQPIIITGFARTGTTFLHNLLARDPDHRALRLWELRGSLTATSPDAEQVEASIRETDAYLQVLYRKAPHFPRIHPMSSTAPDECHWIARHSFATPIYSVAYFLPSFIEWFANHDLRFAMREYKERLQIFQHRSTRPVQLLLKNPDLIWCLDALLEVFPDARIIHTHRSMTEALPSQASLFYTMQSLYSDRGDPQAVGDYVFHSTIKAMDKLLAVRNQTNAENFIDVSYYRLVADPIGTVRDIYERLGKPFSPELDVDMHAWLQANRKDKAGKHAYTLAEFGLDADRIDARYAPYHDRFAAELKAKSDRDRRPAREVARR